MSFQLKNTADNNVLHRNSISAEDFDTQDLKGDWLHIHHPEGELKMRQWIFDGIRMGYSDWSFSKPVTLDWEGDMDVVTMHFSLKGGVSIGIGGNTFELGNDQQNMLYGSSASGFMKADELRLRSFMIQFNKEAFLRIADGGTEALKYFAGQVAENKTAVFSRKVLPVDIAARSAIDAVMNCNFSDPLKRIFFLSKAMELIVLQAESHTRSLSLKPAYIKSAYDRDRILFARDYLLQHISDPPSIPELAKVAGINEFKLKKGYKELFGSTIFGHLASARMELSRTALQERTKTISEIAFELGYSSVQHFSAAFKKKFGIAPSVVNTSSLS